MLSIQHCYQLLNIQNTPAFKLFLRAGAIRPFLDPSRLQVLSVLQRYLVKYEVLLYLVLSSEPFLTEDTFLSPSLCPFPSYHSNQPALHGFS